MQFIKFKSQTILILLKVKRKQKFQKMYNLTNIQEIIDLLKELNGFKKFILYNNVDDESLHLVTYELYHQAVKNFKHTFIPKLYYIFRQCDTSALFFGILRGVISLRTNTKTKKLSLKKHTTSLKYIHSSLRPKAIKFDRNSVIKKFNLLDLCSTEQLFEEEEKLRLSEGMCFGEWGLIYNKERTASAIVIEDADLFTLDKDNFDLSFAVLL